jgi:hypothetical protein
MIRESDLWMQVRMLKARERDGDSTAAVELELLRNKHPLSGPMIDAEPPYGKLDHWTKIITQHSHIWDAVFKEPWNGSNV